jgi:hypothetical protein
MTKNGKTPLDLLRAWVVERASKSAAEWFDEQLLKLEAAPTEKDFHLSLGYAPRRLGKADLALGSQELTTAAAARAGWDPGDWSVDQAARIAMILATFKGDTQVFRDRLETLFRTADVGELITFYRGLPLYPGQELHTSRAREGARSGMRPIFEAVAHRNPYPQEQFDENAWNHMVLKALFIETQLHPIQGLDRRANPRLMRMLCEYAHERWSAGRPVSPELWRCVGPHADEGALADLSRVLEAGGPRERRAAVLALEACPAPAAKRLLARGPQLGDAERRMDWASLARSGL